MGSCGCGRIIRWYPATWYMAALQERHYNVSKTELLLRNVLYTTTWSKVRRCYLNARGHMKHNLFISTVLFSIKKNTSFCSSHELSIIAGIVEKTGCGPFLKKKSNNKKHLLRTYTIPNTLSTSSTFAKHWQFATTL